MLLGDEPRPVCQDLVDLVEVAEFGGDEFEAAQPLGVPPRPQELQHVQVHQVPALVPGCCLQEQHISITAPAGQAPTPTSRSAARTL